MVLYSPKVDHYRSFLLPMLRAPPGITPAEGLPMSHAAPMRITAENVHRVHAERVECLKEVVTFMENLRDDEAWMLLEHKGLIMRVLRDLKEVTQYAK